jgi:hypothetical protein
LCVANLYTDCLTDSNCYQYAYPDAKRHIYGYGDSYGATKSYTNGHIHDHADCYGDGYAYAYGQTNAHCAAQRDAEATS